MLRFHIGDESVTVAHNRVNKLRFCLDLCQKFRRLSAVLLRVVFKIHIVKESGNPPEILIFPVSQFPGVPAHGTFHRKSVKDMEGLLIVFHKKGKRLVSRYISFHISVTPLSFDYDSAV